MTQDCGAPRIDSSPDVEVAGAPPTFATVDAPLAYWAGLRPNAVALDDGANKITFLMLFAAVRRRADELIDAHAPATVWVDDDLSLSGRLVDFLGIVASGRCAAVADPEWPAAVRLHVQGLIDQTPITVSAPGPHTPFYVGFTSGSTGLPKGFCRDHRSWTESFRVCIAEFGKGATTPVLAPGRPSHSLFLFGMLLGLWSGAGVVVQEQFSAARALDALGQGAARCLVAVPSQLLVMLALARRRDIPPAEHVAQIMISGARWIRDRTPELKALFPNARIVEFYGASETSFIAWADASEGLPGEVVGRPFRNVDIDIRGALTAGEPGLIFVRSPMLFLNYVGGQEDDTAALRDGDWLSVRDMGYMDAQARLCLVGRQKRMIVTQGKNLFPEEVETVLMAHPDVMQASVHGIDDAWRGRQVVAIVAWTGQNDAAASTLRTWCRLRLEAYKAPRRYYLCDQWPLTASGKTDHVALAARLVRPEDPASCLRPLL